MRRYTKTKRRQKRRTRRMKGGSEDLISVVVPTYNRFQYLLETIKSIKGQTYPSIEIIVVNDKSTQPEYYSHDFGGDVKLINLKQNSKELYGYACAAHVRNEGIKATKGKWVAFCDDDDVWLPKKLELQIAALKESGCKMACTDGYTGDGKYNPKGSYKLYNAEVHLSILQGIFREKGSDLLARGFPKVWNAEFLEIHNCVITSSVVIAKEVLDTIGNFREIAPPGEDYDCWKRAVKHTDIVYVEEPCFYYDNSHGDGRQYGGGKSRRYRTTRRYQRGGEKKPKAFVYGHLGLGDMCLMIGAIRYLATRYNEVSVVCKNMYKDIMHGIYADNPSIKLFVVDNDLDFTLWKEWAKMYESEGYDVYGSGNFTLKPAVNIYDFPNSFYDDMGIPRTARTEYFSVPQTDAAKSLYEAFKGRPYIVVHEKASNAHLPIVEKLRAAGEKRLIIDVNKNQVDKEADPEGYALAERCINRPFTDYVKLFEGADELHLIDSAVLCFAMHLDLSRVKRCMYHVRPGAEHYVDDFGKFEKVGKVAVIT